MNDRQARIDSLPKYQPKGGMCMSCGRCWWDCSDLSFEEMPVIYRGESTVIVRCTEFERDGGAHD